MGIIDNFLIEEEAKKKRIAEVQKKYPKPTPYTWKDDLNAWGTAASELFNENVQGAKSFAKSTIKNVGQNAVNTINTVGNSTMNMQPQYQPKTTIAPKVKSTANNIGDKIGRGFVDLVDLAGSTAAMSVPTNYNSAPKLVQESEKVYSDLSKNKETKDEIKAFGTKADRQLLKSYENGTRPISNQKDLDTYNQLKTADINRKINNVEKAGIALDIGMIAEMMLSFGTSTPATLGQRAVFGNVENTLKKNLLKQLVERGVEEQSAKLVIENAAKKGMFKEASRIAEERMIKDALIKRGLYNATTDAVAKIGLNSIKAGAAGAIDMGLLGTAQNAYTNYLGITNNNPIEGGIEGAGTGGMFGTAIGGVTGALPYALKGLEKLPLSSKYEKLPNEIVPYKENPNLKYGYNNGNGFYMFNEPTYTNNVQNPTSEVVTPQPQNGNTRKLLPSDIEQIAPQTVAKQRAEQSRSNISTFKKGDVIKDDFGTSTYEVIEPDKKGMGQIRNIETNEVETWNAHNNPRFTKVETPVLAETTNENVEQNKPVTPKKEKPSNKIQTYIGNSELESKDFYSDGNYIAKKSVYGLSGKNTTTRELSDEQINALFDKFTKSPVIADLEKTGIDYKSKQQHAIQYQYTDKDGNSQKIYLSKKNAEIAKGYNLSLVDSYQGKEPFPTILAKNEKGEVVSVLLPYSNDAVSRFDEKNFVNVNEQKAARLEEQRAKKEMAGGRPTISYKVKIKNGQKIGSFISAKDETGKQIYHTDGNALYKTEFVNADISKVEEETPITIKAVEDIWKPTEQNADKLEDIGKVYPLGKEGKARVFKLDDKYIYVNDKYLLDKKNIELYANKNKTNGAISIKRNGEQIGLVMPIVPSSDALSNLIDVPKMKNLKATPKKEVVKKSNDISKIAPKIYEKQNAKALEKSEKIDNNTNENSEVSQNGKQEQVNERNDQATEVRPLDKQNEVSEINARNDVDNGRGDNSGLRVLDERGNRGRITPEHSELVNKKYKNQHELNKAIEEFINNKEYEKYSELPEEIKEWLKKYAGAGGLEKQGALGKGLLSEYYTPKNVVKKMWDLTSQYIETNGANALEPSVGIGRFLENAPDNINFDVVEMNPVSAKITELLYPNANVEVGEFQKRFINPKTSTPVKEVTPEYDIVIGNPPYGQYSGRYKGLGEGKGISRFETYFIKRGLDLLKDNGVMAYIIPSSFLDSPMSPTKLEISRNSEILDAYRLPENTFDTTSIGTDIIILRKGKNETNRDSFNSGKWFEQHPEKILGEVLERKNRFGKMENYVKGSSDVVETIDTSSKDIKETAKTVKKETVKKEETAKTTAKTTKAKQNKKEIQYKEYEPKLKVSDEDMKDFENETSNNGYLDILESLDLPPFIYEEQKAVGGDKDLDLENINNLIKKGVSGKELAKFLPDELSTMVRIVADDYKFINRITTNKRKLGYHSSERKVIAINLSVVGNNPYKFVETLMHEVRHADQEKYYIQLLRKQGNGENLTAEEIEFKEKYYECRKVNKENQEFYNKNKSRLDKLFKKIEKLDNDEYQNFIDNLKYTDKKLIMNYNTLYANYYNSFMEADARLKGEEYARQYRFEEVNSGNKEYTTRFKEWLNRKFVRNKFSGNQESIGSPIPTGTSQELKEVEKKAKNYIREWYSDIEKNRYDVNKALTSLINITKQYSREFKSKGIKATDKQIRELMPFLRERTEFPDKLDRPDLKNIWDKLSDTQKDKLRNLADSVSKKFEKYYEEYQNSKGAISENDIKNHISHIWDLDNKHKSLLTNYFTTKSRFAKERTIDTLYKGIQGIEINGETVYFTPKVLDYAEILKTSSDTFIKATADMNLANVVKNIKYKNKPLLLPITKAPADWVEVNHPALNKGVYMGGNEDLTIVGKVAVKVHPAIARTIKTVFETPAESNAIITGYDKLNSLYKQAQLGFSGFHMVALSESMVGNMGMKETLKLLNPKRIYDEVVKGNWSIYKDDSFAKQAIEDGLQIGATLDLDRKGVEQLVDNTANWIEKRIPVVGKYFAKLPKAISKLQKANNIVLWDYLHNNYKLECYKLLCLQESKKRKLTDNDRREIAQWVNDSFGGQIWENLGIVPSGRRAEQRIFLSPDWLRSTTRQFLGIFSSEKLSNALSQKANESEFWKKAKDLGERWGINSNTDDVTSSGMRGRIARSFWLRAIIYSAILYNVMNALFRMKDYKEHKDLYPEKMSLIDYSILGNTKGNKTYVFIGRNSDGTERYLRLGKQFREIPEMVTDPIKKLGGKFSPNAQIISQIFTGNTPSGFMNKDFYENTYTKDKKQGIEYGKAIGKTIAKSFVPYSLNSLSTPDKDMNIWSFFAPVAKGMTKGKGKYLYSKNMYNEKPLAEVTKSLKRNGYSNEEITETYKKALSDTRIGYRNEYIEAIKTNNEENIVAVTKKLKKKGLSNEEITIIYTKALDKIAKEKE